jgi:hypothetical protein
LLIIPSTHLSLFSVILEKATKQIKPFASETLKNPFIAG